MFVSVVALLRCCVKSLFLANVKEFYLELFDSKIKIFMVYISFNIILLCYFFLVLFVLLNLESIVNIIKILIFPFSFSILLCYRIYHDLSCFVLLDLNMHKLIYENINFFIFFFQYCFVTILFNLKIIVVFIDQSFPVS